jgi:hypothetical protein
VNGCRASRTRQGCCDRIQEQNPAYHGAFGKVHEPKDVASSSCKPQPQVASNGEWSSNKLAKKCVSACNVPTRKFKRAEEYMASRIMQAFRT